ncbi:MAG: glycosyltransferase [Deltaproteobacteria bacterium]|nr:glycosyltransferase [Deltaproteobacteria bacterium]
MKVGAAVTTYNKPKVLKICLEGILNQSYALNQIVVVDNSEDDSTEKMILSDYPGIIYRHLTENTGSAGGFHEGIKIACRNNDFVWTLDDDISSEKETLEQMLSYLSFLDPRGKIGVIRPNYGKQMHDFIEVKGFAWRGALISRGAIQEVGFPDRRFFIYGEDMEYSLRIRNAGYKIYNVFAGRLKEVIPTPRHMHRMLGLKVRFYTEDFRLYYAFRNQVWIYTRYRKYLQALRLFLHAFKGVLLFLFEFKASNIAAIIQGLFHGLVGKLGRNENYAMVKRK